MLTERVRVGSGRSQKPSTPMAANKVRSARERDPLAELAQLIAQANTQEESALPDNRSREKTVSDGYGEAPELPPAPQLTVDLNDEQDCSGVRAHDDQPYAAEEEYQDNEVPHYAAEEEHQDSEVPHHAAEEEYQDSEVPHYAAEEGQRIMKCRASAGTA